MLSATLSQPAVRPFAHPNDLDRKRIERALKARKRYRTCAQRDDDDRRLSIEPVLFETLTGTAASSTSRCCCMTPMAKWQLFRKDHKNGLWQLIAHERLPLALERLNVDPERTFWQ
jgi:hypothetical protein